MITGGLHPLAERWLLCSLFTATEQGSAFLFVFVTVTTVTLRVVSRGAEESRSWGFGRVEGATPEQRLPTHTETKSGHLVLGLSSY